jgi:hypothetical protein
MQMPTLRIEKNRNYTVMSNYHLRDKRLKLKTIGLMSLMLSLPEDWEFSEMGLTTICNDGITAIKAALHELEIYGYLTRSYIRGENGRYTNIEYILREYPMLENPISVNHIEINKDLTKYRKDDGECGFPDSGKDFPLRDPAYAEVSAEYQRNFGYQPMGIVSDILGDGIRDTCKEAVIYAIHTAKEAMAKNPYRYAEKVILSLIEAGVTDAEKLEAYKESRSPSSQTKKAKTFVEIAAELDAQEAEQNGRL